jgi:hypothetical protein
MNPADLGSLIYSAGFVLNSLLVCIGALIIVAAILVADNLIHRFWKPIKLVSYVQSDEVEPIVSMKTAKKDTENK